VYIKFTGSVLNAVRVQTWILSLRFNRTVTYFVHATLLNLRKFGNMRSAELHRSAHTLTAAVTEITQTYFTNYATLLAETWMIPVNAQPYFGTSCCYLGYDTVWSGTCVPTFWRHIKRPFIADPKRTTLRYLFTYLFICGFLTTFAVAQISLSQVE
jgi:hypothetical protein